MDKVIEILEAKAAHYYMLYQNEMRNGSAAWAMKYEYMWHGLESGINAVKEERQKAKKVPV